MLLGCLTCSSLTIAAMKFNCVREGVTRDRVCEYAATHCVFDDFHDRSCYATRVGVLGDDSAKRLLDLVTITGIRARFVCRDASKIRRSPGVGEMVGALREGARHDD